MAQRPYWTGQIRLSLVTLPVEIFTAVKSSASQVDLDQIDRKSGERVHHMKRAGRRHRGKARRYYQRI